MPDLQDGESTEMQGSGSRPYVLKNVGGVYSCTCPAWRNQSVAIERRTCKHLRKFRGDKAEEDRLGSALPARPQPKGDEGEDAAAGPPISSAAIASAPARGRFYKKVVGRDAGLRNPRAATYNGRRRAEEK